jgi:steroid 5-alpha reductase family enzyme
MKKQTTIAGSLVAVALGIAVGLAGSDGGESLTDGGMRIFFALVLFAFAVNWVVFVPSFIARTEHYYDLTGSLTYISVTLVALLATDTRDTRTVIIAVLIMVWAGRLGSFLFARVKKAGKDGRFDRIKHDPLAFLMFWTIQGLWITFTAAAALAAMTSGAKVDFGIVSLIGLVVWIAGFAIEVVADRQKTAFRADPANAGRFITEGLWSRSRHPNYFGEFLLWTGMAIIAAPALQGWQYITLLSPVFVFVLLNRVSGVPALEARADKKWGGEADYEAYKAATPVFFLRVTSG